VAARQFVLVTHWHFDAPIERVWTLIERTDDWPLWWPAVRAVTTLREGDARGIGAVRRLSWRTALPYSLSFDVEVTQIEPLAFIEGRASGELDGVGQWTFAADGERTVVRYEWRVEVTKPWMRLMVPVLRPAFAWNHGKVMAWGEDGGRKRLALGKFCDAKLAAPPQPLL
jgi:uncharacterized protein YndB with AHSA1/START domain